MLHLIPDDQAHAPTTECGCDPQLHTRNGVPVLVHFRPRPQVRCTWEFDDGSTWPGPARPEEVNRRVTTPISNDTGKPELLLTAEQWRRIRAIGLAVERQRARDKPEPDTGETDPPTWENL